VKNCSSFLMSSALLSGILFAFLQKTLKHPSLSYVWHLHVVYMTWGIWCKDHSHAIEMLHLPYERKLCMQFMFIHCRLIGNIIHNRYHMENHSVQSYIDHSDVIECTYIFDMSLCVIGMCSGPSCMFETMSTMQWWGHLLRCTAPMNSTIGKFSCLLRWSCFDCDGSNLWLWFKLT
jgi:hypothetical protein